MKVGTTEKIKFDKLRLRLKESKRGIVGLLELLWAGVAKNCPRGDVGRFPNEDIAIMCDWSGDPDELVAALVECRWVDEHPECRLVIHDWSDHAPSWVRGNIEFSGGFIVDRKVDPKDTPKGTPKDTPEDTPEGYPTYTKPIPSLYQTYTRPDQSTPTNQACEAVVGELAKILEEAGVELYKQAAESAASSGFTADQIRGLVSYANSRKKKTLGPGYIYSVCIGKSAFPDLPPTQKKRKRLTAGERAAIDGQLCRDHPDWSDEQIEKEKNRIIAQRESA
jgi:hypothetical protein